MKNLILGRNVKYLIENLPNVAKISKGDVSGLSIEIQTIDPESFDSYLYKDKLTRDYDFDELIELTKWE